MLIQSRLYHKLEVNHDPHYSRSIQERISYQNERKITYMLQITYIFRGVNEISLAQFNILAFYIQNHLIILSIKLWFGTLCFFILNKN